MSWDGMLPDGITCKRCRKKLNADGGHPAERYAGTYNGLCYACTSAGAYTESTLPDGCTIRNVPPHCPSWRRTREVYHAYPDCPDCKGEGYRMVSRSYPQGGPYPAYCEPCTTRFSAHPVRAAHSRTRDRARSAFRAANTLYRKLTKRMQHRVTWKRATETQQKAMQELLGSALRCRYQIIVDRYNARHPQPLGWY